MGAASSSRGCWSGLVMPICSLSPSGSSYNSLYTSSSSLSSSLAASGVKTTHKRRRTCMCSPTTHPGSFRCSLHKKPNSTKPTSDFSPNNGPNITRFFPVKNLLVKRALAASNGPSSHQQTRRVAFQPRPSRLSIMSKDEDDLSSN